MATESSQQVIIRDVEGSDAPRVADLLTQLGYPVSADEVRERLAYWLADEMSRILVAEGDGTVVGCISLHPIPYLERTGRWLRIESLVVDELARGAGVGQMLIDAAQETARDWNCIAVEVTSARHRPGAHAFYRRLGFHDASDRSARFVKLLD